MVQEGMPPEVASFAMAVQGIIAPAEVLYGLAKPGVMDGLGERPFTHARTDQHIAAHKNMMTSLEANVEENEPEEDPVEGEVIDDED
jgi:hypothetical protein